jgi:hypothetical protein
VLRVLRYTPRVICGARACCCSLLVMASPGCARSNTADQPIEPAASASISLKADDSAASSGTKEGLSNELPGKVLEKQAPAAAAEQSSAAGHASFEKTAGIVELKREGTPSVLRAVRAASNPGHDRVVFEFDGGVPGFHLEYIDKPVRDCGAGDVKPIAGDGWLEVRFYPAYAHTEEGQPTVRERELRPALPIVREIERTCDFEAVVTWVVGTASPNRYRVFELSAPSRLVVDIDH